MNAPHVVKCPPSLLGLGRAFFRTPHPSRPAFTLAELTAGSVHTIDAELDRFSRQSP